MVTKIPSEKFWELYKNLSPELKEALSGPKTGNDVFDICQRNGISDKTEEIVDCLSLVLIGLLPPEEFQQVLEKELKISPEIAKRVNQEIYRFILFPIKAHLEVLYKKELISVAQPSRIVPPPGEKPKTEPREDIYREPIE